MAWVKVPPDNHPLFLAALPRDPRVSTVRMFGGVVAKANGYMFGGLFARSIVVRLSPADRLDALALDGTAPFDPMGNGRVMTDTLLMSEQVMDEPGELRDWLARAFAHAVSLPPKLAAAKRTAAKPAAQRPAAKPAAQRPAAKPAAQRPAAKPAAQRAAAKPAAQRPAAKPAARSSTAQRPAAKPAAQRAAAKQAAQRPAAKPAAQRPAARRPRPPR